jgi:flagellar hook-associated protein 1 FlgK
LTDPAKVAAASPIITGNTAGNQGSGAISAGSVGANYLTTPLSANVTLTYNSATNKFSGFPAGAAVTVTPANGVPDPASPYAAGTPVPYSAGAKMTFNGITVTINGAPSNGDTFTIGKNTGGVSDGSNALLLGALQNKKTMGNSTASFNDAYGQLVSTVGNKARQVEISNKAQTSLTLQIRTAQQSVSGVNQDEETANLLMFQQMYQANAKVIQTASTMFDAVLGIR